MPVLTTVNSSWSISRPTLVIGDRLIVCIANFKGPKKKFLCNHILWYLNSEFRGNIMANLLKNSFSNYCELISNYTIFNLRYNEQTIETSEQMTCFACISPWALYLWWKIFVVGMIKYCKMFPVGVLKLFRYIHELIIAMFVIIRQYSLD